MAVKKTFYKFGEDFQLVKLTMPTYIRTRAYCQDNNLYYQDWCDAVLEEAMDKNVINYAEKSILELDDCLPIVYLKSQIIKDIDLDIEKTLKLNNGVIVFMVECDNLPALREYCENNWNKLYNLVGYDTINIKNRPILKYLRHTVLENALYKHNKQLKPDGEIKKDRLIFALLNGFQIKNNIKETLEMSLSMVITDDTFLSGLQNPTIEWYPDKLKDYKPVWKHHRVKIEKTYDAYWKLKDSIIDILLETIKKNETEHILYNANLADKDDLNNKINMAMIHLSKKSDGLPNKMIINPELYEKLSGNKIFRKRYTFEKTNYTLFGFDVILADAFDHIVLYRNNKNFITLYYNNYKCKIGDLYLHLHVPENLNDNIIQIPVLKKSDIAKINIELEETLKNYNWISINRNDIFYNLHKIKFDTSDGVRNYILEFYKKAVDTTSQMDKIVITNTKGLVKYLTNTAFVPTEYKPVLNSYHLFGMINETLIYLDPYLNNDVEISYTLSKIEIDCNRYIITDMATDINNEYFIAMNKINTDIKILI